MSMTLEYLKNAGKKPSRSAKSKLMSIVRDRQGNEWYSHFNEADFDLRKDNYVVEVYDAKGAPVKKFLKGYLKFIRETEDTKIISEEDTLSEEDIENIVAEPIDAKVIEEVMGDTKDEDIIVPEDADIPPEEENSDVPIKVEAIADDEDSDDE